jgi:hypothetical protein
MVLYAYPVYVIEIVAKSLRIARAWWFCKVAANRLANFFGGTILPLQILK